MRIQVKHIAITRNQTKGTIKTPKSKRQDNYMK